MCRWGSERGDTGEKVGWDREALLRRDTELSISQGPWDSSRCFILLRTAGMESSRFSQITFPLGVFEGRSHSGL